MTADLRELIPLFMFWFLLPIWLIAGVADYLLHRRTRIESTSGLGESALHVLQAIEIAIPLLAGLFLEINSLVLLVMIACVLAHTLTAIWDVAYTVPRRLISPIEQHVHSHLEYIPIVAVSLTVLLHWESFLSLAHSGPDTFANLRLREKPIPLPYVLSVLAVVFLVQGLLLAQETIRTWRARASRRHPPRSSGDGGPGKTNGHEGAFWRV